MPSIKIFINFASNKLLYLNKKFARKMDNRRKREEKQNKKKQIVNSHMLFPSGWWNYVVSKQLLMLTWKVLFKPLCINRFSTSGDMKNRMLSHTLTRSSPHVHFATNDFQRDNLLKVEIWWRKKSSSCLYLLNHFYVRVLLIVMWELTPWRNLLKFIYIEFCLSFTLRKKRKLFYISIYFIYSLAYSRGSAWDKVKQNLP